MSIASPPVAAARDVAYPRIGAGIVAMAALAGGQSGVFREAEAAASLSAALPPSSRCVGLPLQTALGPLLASASRGPVGLQGRQTGRDPRVAANNKMVTLRNRCRCFKHYVEPVFDHRFARAELVSGGRVIVGRHGQ